LQELIGAFLCFRRANPGSRWFESVILLILQTNNNPINRRLKKSLAFWSLA
jgi:hypothetical protein